MVPYKLPSAEAVRDAALLLSSMVFATPVKGSLPLTNLANENLENSKCVKKLSQIELFFKCENLQYTGSFKFRGACHFLAKLDNLALSNGVVAYSTGNHAQAVAHAARLASETRHMSIPSYVVVPSNCPPKKVIAARSTGAAVFLSGTDPNDRVLLAKRIQHATGAILVPPADHLNIVLGQATAVHEFLEQVSHMGKELDAVIVPSGGGGLLCGAIAACKTQGATVFGCEPECGGPGLAAGLERGTRTMKIQGSGSIADGLRSLTGEANWEHIRAEGNVEKVFTVSEAQIEEALKAGVKELGFSIEPSAAVPLAVALYSDAFHEWVASANRRVRVGIVLTGGNVGLEGLALST